MRRVIDATRRGLRLATSATARNSIWAMVNQGIVVLTGLATFYTLGSRLGVELYGIYAAAVAVVHIGSSLANLGVNQLAVREWSRDEGFRRPWAMAVGTHVAGGLLTAATLSLLQPIVAPSFDRWPLALLAVTEAAFLAIVLGAVVFCEGIGRARTGARVRTLGSLVRLAALGVFVLLKPTLTNWVVVSFSASIAAAALAVALLGRAFGGIDRPRLVPRDDLGRGFGMATNRLLVSTQTDVDKAILAASGMAVAAGVYAAGYRVVILSGLPLTGVVAGTLGRFFVEGGRSLKAAMALASKASTVSIAVTVPVGVVLFVVAPVLPLVMGDDFSESVDVVRWLAFLPCLKALQVFPANALTGADRQAVRVAALIAAVVLNVGLNLVLIPSYSWQGAVAATWISELLLALVLWLALRSLAAREAP